MVVGAGSGGRVAVTPAGATEVILLDTNALLWLDRGHPRSKPLRRFAGRLYASPAAILEIQFLVELGKVRLSEERSVAALEEDPRWFLDDPPAAGWFREAHSLSWTRDPFDRLLVAHALQREWRLATGDRALLEHLPERQVVEL